MNWMTADRVEMGADRILDAAGELFAAKGIGQPGMQDIAEAAGCSRATVYRYFESKPALLEAFVRREAKEITDSVGEHSLVASVVGIIAAIRARPYLRAWWAGEDTSVLADVLRESALIPSMEDADLGRWVVRIVLSFLREPGTDAAEERRLLERFLT